MCEPTGQTKVEQCAEDLLPNKYGAAAPPDLYHALRGTSKTAINLGTADQSMPLAGHRKCEHVEGTRAINLETTEQMLPLISLRRYVRVGMTQQCLP
jgi:hypothetical protein